MSRNRIIQLQECAEDLGFGTIQEALDAGYHEVQDMVNGTFTLEKIDNMVEQEKAHEAWLKERDTLLKNLEEQEEFARESYEVDHTVIRHAIEFIRKGEC